MAKNKTFAQDLPEHEINEIFQAQSDKAAEIADLWVKPLWEDVKGNLDHLKHCWKVVNGSEVRESDVIKILGTSLHRNVFDAFVKKMSEV